MRQYCTRGHDTYATGRDRSGGCSQCQRNYVRTRKAERDSAIRGIKLERGCVRCGYNDHPSALSFHHRDPSTKRFCLGHAGTYSWENILLEIEKCDVMCANCHLAHHSQV